jgi:hypothetical protein
MGSEGTEHVRLERLRQRDRYGVLLVLILASLLAVTISDRGTVGQLIASSAIVATLLFALHTSDPPRRLRRAAWIGVGVCFAVAVVFAIAEVERTTEMAIAAANALLVVATIAAILRRVAMHPKIDLATVGGALCVYLLIGMLFAFVDIFTAAASDAPFFAQTSDPNAIDFLYFSFITLSTTGYGDLSPIQNLGRMLAVTEAVTGQLYLVSAVALVIGNLGQTRPRAREDGEIDAPQGRE